MNILLSIINILFSPFSLIFFLAFSFGIESFFFIKEKTNTIRLKLIPYLFFSFIYLITILTITYTLSFYIDVNIWKILIPKNVLISLITWLITLLTLSTYLKGMEGNIMGFIFFPLLTFSILILCIFSFSDILSYWKTLTLSLPTLNINFWLRLILHSFSPFYILLFLSPIKHTKEKNINWITPVFSSLILQVFMFLFNWIIIYLFGSSLTFSQFFGQKQTIIYYIPMAVGFLFFIFKIVEHSNKDKLKTFVYYTNFLSIIFIVLGIINYLNLIIPFFK